MAATIKDIASKTGLGVATVSYYLNGGHVRPQNREKIETAIRELHYEVNETARQLKTNRTRMIGAIIPELNSTFCATVLSRIEDILRQHGYAMVICDCRSNAEREEEAADFLFRRRVDGLFNIPVDSSGRHLRSFQKAGKPVVLIDRQIDSLNCDSVCVDNYRAVRSAVQLLADRGHRKIGLLACPQSNHAARQRLRGYRQALEEAGIRVEDSLIYQGEDTIDSGTRGMDALIDRNPEMTAVIAASYRMTFGAVIAANERTICIPDQLSLVGFDNPQFARAVHPRLTIINQPVEQIGDQAAEIMIRRLGGEGPAEPEHLWLPTEILAGKSVRGCVNRKENEVPVNPAV